MDQVQESDRYPPKELNNQFDLEQEFKAIHLKMTKWENFKMHLAFDEILLQIYLNKTCQWVAQDEWTNLLEEDLIPKSELKPQVLKSLKNQLLESFKQAQVDLIKERCFQIQDLQHLVNKDHNRMMTLCDRAQDQVLKKDL